MNQKEIFGNSIWVTAPHCENRPEGAYILRSKFEIKSMKHAKLYVLGLGFFHCYINGKKVGEDEFLPLNTDYEPRRDCPREEKLMHHRVYVPVYDITDMLKEGENVLALHFGGGWYTFCEGKFGDAKAIWRICVEGENGTEEFGSSVNDRIENSYTDCVYFTRHEHQDLQRVAVQEVFCPEFDDLLWSHAVPARPVETDYRFSDCPADRLSDTLLPTCIKYAGENSRRERTRVYDTGKNTAAIPFFRITAKAGEEITILFAEEKTAGNCLDMRFHFNQKLTIIADGREQIVRPVFTWFCFRYFSISGDAEPLYVRELHSDVEINSDFSCDNENLNWLYQAFLNTQLSNMHAGIPSDCPHIERRGYTGDGQLICHAAMDVLDGEEFYRKWIYDISDCQDVHTGHVQYTAPYLPSGGGPGGWGCAIIEVPYQFYRHYGDKKPLEDLYGQMLGYFGYLEAHSANGLVTSDKEGEWCLGDWCPPMQVILPAPFVNNYFYIKSLERMIEIAGLLHKEEDITLFRERIRSRKEAITAAYFNPWDGNFLGNMQGANAFAVDIGLGDERTYNNLVKRYQELGCYDTGIFGTDVITRVFFEHGDGETAVKLMTSEKPHSFGGMRLLGASSIWEYWPNGGEFRSHNHPMFGAITAYLFDCILGIGQTEDSCGYEKLVIQPFVPEKMSFAQGHRTLPGGKVSVKWEKAGDKIRFQIETSQTAAFRFGGEEKILEAGRTELEYRL